MFNYLIIENVFKKLKALFQLEHVFCYLKVWNLLFHYYDIRERKYVSWLFRK